MIGCSHTCEHLLVALKVPASHPKDAPIPWDTDPNLKQLRRSVDTDVVVAEVRETSRKPDEVYGVIERCFTHDDAAFYADDLRLAPQGRKLGK